MCFSYSFIDGISDVAQGKGRQFDKVPKNCGEVVSVRELTESVFKGRKRVYGGVGWWFFARFRRHQALDSF